MIIPAECVLDWFRWCNTLSTTDFGVIASLVANRYLFLFTFTVLLVFSAFRSGFAFYLWYASVCYVISFHDDLTEFLCFSLFASFLWCFFICGPRFCYIVHSWGSCVWRAHGTYAGHVVLNQYKWPPSVFLDLSFLDLSCCVSSPVCAVCLLLCHIVFSIRFIFAYTSLRRFDAQPHIATYEKKKILSFSDTSGVFIRTSVI